MVTDVPPRERSLDAEVPHPKIGRLFIRGLLFTTPQSAIFSTKIVLVLALTIHLLMLMSEKLQEP
jgi:hypothetical protein